MSKLKDVVYFPIMIASLTLWILYYTLTEVETMLIVAFSVVMGIQLGLMWGLAVFLGIYIMARTMNEYVSLIASKLHLLASVSDRRNQ